MDLKQIFDTITPENIKEIPLLRTAMEIFLNNLKKNSRISIDIYKIFENYQNSAGTLSEESAKNIKGALLDTYISELFNTIKRAQNNKDIQNRLDNLDITDAPINSDAVKIFDNEHFSTNKSFKENIGTESGIKYAYNLTKYLEGKEDTSDIKITNIKPFHMHIDGTITADMYNNITNHLAHPIGFTYAYFQIVEASLRDLFGITITYDVKSLEVRELSGSFDVFTEFSDDTVVKNSFITRGWTSEEYDEAVSSGIITLHLNKIVELINPGTASNLRLDITFTDGTVLTQTYSPIDVTYKDNSGNTIKVFAGQNSIFSDYEEVYNVNYVDEIEFVLNFTPDYDLFDVTNPVNVSETIVFSIISEIARYFNTTDNYYFVSGDGSDPANEFYFTFNTLSRYFLEFDKVINSTAILDTDWNPAGDFEIEIDFATTTIGDNLTLIGNSADSRGFLRLDNNGRPNINFTSSGNADAFGLNDYRDGKLHHIKIIASSGELEVFVDTVSLGTLSPDISNINFNVIGKRSTVDYFDGVIANVKLTDTDTPANSQFYELNRAKNTTETSSIGSGTVSYTTIPEANRFEAELVENRWQNKFYPNLLTYSQDFSNWSTIGTNTITSNAIAAPDGSITADLITDTDTDAGMFYIQNIVPADNDSLTKTFSIHLKEGSAAETRIAMYFTGSGTTAAALAEITWSNNSIDGGANLESLGDGWYRASISLANNSSGTTHVRGRVWPSSSSAGDTGSVYAWGGQVEPGSVATEYKKTTDVASKSLTIAG